MTCDLYAPDDGRCVWCHGPESDHRFVPCQRCGGHPFLPDPSDRSPVPLWARRKIPCGCAGEDRWGGWIDRTTGKPAEDAVLWAAGWRPGSGAACRMVEARMSARKAA